MQTWKNPTRYFPRVEPTNPVHTGGLEEDVEDIDSQLMLPPSPALREHIDFRHSRPPDKWEHGKFSLFTAGSIEMGKAIQWQLRLVDFLKDLPVTVTNPRRGRWDPNVDAKASDSVFCKQVEWELNALDAATVICFFFDVNTRSAVTMMELGLWARSRKVVVCCGKKFWRQGNIQLVCKRHNIPFVEEFGDLVLAIKDMLEEKGMEIDEKAY
jgi:hypothetical protein